MDVLKISGLKMAYEGKTVFENLSFSLSRGKVLFILGENGSGKSTLIKGILGLLRPAEGEIKWEGIDKKSIAYLSQQTEVRKEFPASVEEIVLSGRLTSKKITPFYSKKDKLKALESMKNLSVENLRSRSFSELSGGQQQRVLLARALCADAEVLVLDEPSKGLDSKVTEELYELLWHLNACHKITVIMVSHDIEAAKKYASDILCLSEDSYEIKPQEEFFREGK